MFHAGFETGYLPELRNVEYPDRVTTLHASLIAAASDIILTNSFGASCGMEGAELLGSVQKFVHREENPSLIARGNCGISAYVDWKVHFHGTPKLMADCAVLTRDSGVNVLSGCCGTSPEHVQVMAQALNQTPLREDKQR